MFERRSLKWPITLGVIMIVLIVALTVGWILLAVSGGGWTLLTVGTTFLVLVLVGVVMYLSLSVKEINLNRRQSNFMDAVTHELKSPIASLKLCLQTLHIRQVSEEEQANFFRYMLEDVERLDDLINHLLDAAKLSKPAIDSEMEDLELNELLPRWVFKYSVMPLSRATKISERPSPSVSITAAPKVVSKSLLERPVPFEEEASTKAVPLNSITLSGWAYPPPTNTSGVPSPSISIIADPRNGSELFLSNWWEKGKSTAVN